MEIKNDKGIEHKEHNCAADARRRNRECGRTDTAGKEGMMRRKSGKPALPGGHARALKLILMIIALHISACSPRQLPDSVIASSTVPLGETGAAAAALTSTFTPTLLPTATPLAPKLVEFYHLRFEYTVTSDWATLDILNPEIIMAIEAIETTGSPQVASLSSTQVNVYRPVADMAQNPRVVIVFDVAIHPGKIGEPLQITSSHGALLGSGLKVWLIGENMEARQLEEINHYWVSQDNPDTSAWNIQISLDPLGEEEPEQTLVPQVPAKMAWAVYYPWYGENFYPRAWSSDIWTDRPMTAYESDDPEGIRQHIEWARSAGIDGFLVEWCGIGRAGDNDVIDRNFGEVLDIAYRMDFKVAAYYDQLCINDADPGRIEAQLEYLLTQRANHPGYFRMDGKPVVVMYSTNTLEPSAWQVIFDHLASKDIHGIYMAESYDINQLDVFNGLHQYINLFTDDLDGIYEILSQSVVNASVFEPQKLTFWAATISPGFDNTPLSQSAGILAPQGTPTIVDRNDAHTYRTYFEKAISSDAPWVIITSWNEWQENTHIEPSQMYGDLYLQITREYLASWKGY